MVRDPLAGKELYNWQILVKELVQDEPDPRKIYWFWEKNGNVGKTSFCKHLILSYPREVLYVNGAIKDVMYAIGKFHEDPNNNLKICIFDFERTSEDKISYAALEKVKDGIAFSAKYESCSIVFDTPHVLCFANWTPVVENLSRDRWVVSKLKKD